MSLIHMDKSQTLYISFNLIGRIDIMWISCNVYCYPIALLKYIFNMQYQTFLSLNETRSGHELTSNGLSLHCVSL